MKTNISYLVFLTALTACVDSGGGEDETGDDGGDDIPQGSMELVAAVQGSPVGMESDDSFVYLMEGVSYMGDTARLLAIAKSDLEATELSLVEGYALNSDADRLYWFGSENGLYDTVESIPKAGGTVSTVTTGLTWGYTCMDMASDGDSLFIVGSSLAEGTIATVSTTGGVATAVGTVSDDLCYVTVDDDQVYAAAGMNHTAVYRAPKAGGDLEELASDDQIHLALTSGSNGEMELADGTLYWTSDYHNQHGGGAVTGLSVSGGSIQELALEQDSPYDLVVDNGDVFWVNSADGFSEDGQIMRLEAGASEPEVLVEGLAQPYYIQVDDTHIYFTAQDPETRWDDEEAGFLYRIAR